MIIVFKITDHFLKDWLPSNDQSTVSKSKREENQCAKYLAPVWRCRVTTSDLAFSSWPWCQQQQGQESVGNYEEDRNVKPS